jgi:hypothetical protein
LAGTPQDKALEMIQALPADSIYDGIRVATPDEVWNFGRGDGFEKAVLAANLLAALHPGTPVTISKTGNTVTVDTAGDSIFFETEKDIPDFQETLTPAV